MTDETSKDNDFQQPIQLTVEENSASNNHPSKENLPELEVSGILPTNIEGSNIEDSWGDEKKTIPVGWYTIAAIALFSILGFAIYSIFKAAPKQSIKNNNKNEILYGQKQEKKEDKEILANMQETVRGYLSATKPSELLPYVRNKQRVTPLIKHYYKTNTFTPLEFEHFSEIRPIAIRAKAFAVVRVLTHSGKQIPLLLEQVDNKKFKVDWETNISYMPMPWEKYIKEQPTPLMDFRVYIKKDNFYAYEFSDEKKYQSYRLSALNSTEYLFAFTEKDSVIDRKLKKYTTLSDKKNTPLILRLKFPKNSRSKRCVIIDSFLTEGWIYTTPPPPLPKE